MLKLVHDRSPNRSGPQSCLPEVTLRPFQTLALKELWQSRNERLICVAPTGSGKSLIFETYIKQAGCKALLISPLVALARQHHERLTERGVTAAIGSTFQPADPDTRAWVISPESLQHESTHRKLEAWKPEFLIVDECHCLWEWGTSFRPAFLEIPKLLERHSFFKKSLWLTATLTPENRGELRGILANHGRVAELGATRLPDQLGLQVQKVAIAERLEIWTQEVLQTETPGIVFAGTRKNTERLAEYSRHLGLKAAYYHAGLGREERQLIENQIKSNRVRLIVATSAFGMGMDFPQLSRAWIWQPPWSLLELSQAIGRVGRAEKPGHATVYWDPWDFRMLIRHPQTPQYVLDRLNPVRTFLESRVCRRTTLSQVFGNSSETLTCLQNQAQREPSESPPIQLCDICLAWSR